MVSCGRPWKKGEPNSLVWCQQHLDHLIPRRYLDNFGINPHQEGNMLSVCGSCHGKKKGYEDKLFRGDLQGYLSGLRMVGYPLDRIMNFALSVGLKEFGKFGWESRGQL